MTDNLDFSDERLTAYLDGEADGKDAAELEAALGKSPDLRKRLDQLRIDNVVISRAGKALLAGAPPVPDSVMAAAAMEPKPRNLRLPAMAVGALLCFLVGAGAGKLLFSQSRETWQDFAAVYHALYVANTLTHIDQSEAVAKAELERVSDAIGKTINLADLQTGALDYKRAQILGFKGKPLLQLAFLSKIGAPVALCIFRSGEGASAKVAAATMRGLSSAYWSKGGYEFLLIGGTDQKLITDAAETFARII